MNVGFRIGIFKKISGRMGILGIFNFKFRLFRTVYLSNGYQNSSLKNIFKKNIKKFVDSFLLEE